MKSTSDALNGIIWTDDNCIVGLVAEKYYTDKPHLVVEVDERAL
ncbi:RusA family crossover junction endodeoxyribonuclease [Limosilactobacillus fermentum]|nr:RusA family crossover junction endodeoxyribonuclease [Limosilactobacillus fermentum]